MSRDEIPEIDEYSDDKCYFCGSIVRVNVYESRKSKHCKCGARHFIRKVWRNGEVINEEEGWRLAGNEVVY